MKPKEKIVIGGRIFTPATERINGSDIDETQLSPIYLPNLDYVQKMTDMENILEEILAKEAEILMSPIRFNGVHIEHIKQVFEKYGIIYEPKF